MIGETINGQVAIAPIAAVKLEAEIKGGFATISQKHNLIAAEMILDFAGNGSFYKAGDYRVLLKGDAAFTPWAKQVFEHDGVKFVLAPIGFVIGFVRVSAGE